MVRQVSWDVSEWERAVAEAKQLLGAKRVTSGEPSDHSFRSLTALHRDQKMRREITQHLTLRPVSALAAAFDAEVRGVDVQNSR
jgi:hypothetical protein